MLRINELKLPLEYPSEALRAVIVQRLKIKSDELLSVRIFKRSHDARKKNNLLLCNLARAGTFSDGKLYSQIKDPKHHERKVIVEFIKAGAPDEITYIVKPHIGMFR